MDVPWTWTFSTLGCGDRDLEGIAACARRFGLAQIEVRMVDGRMDLPRLLTERFGEPARLRDWLAGKGLTICSLDTSFKLAAAGDEAKEELLAFVPWAEGLGVPWLRVFDGGSADREMDEAACSIMADAVAWWRGLRAARGWRVDLMMETHDATVRARNLRALQARLGEPVPVLWDTHHPWCKAGEDLATTWEAARRVVHLHIKDSVVDEGDPHGYRYVNPGDGRFPFDTLWSILRDGGFRGAVSLEWERAWHPYLAPVEEPLAAMAARFGMGRRSSRS